MGKKKKTYHEQFFLSLETSKKPNLKMVRVHVSLFKTCSLSILILCFRARKYQNVRKKNLQKFAS